jgi:hypothetical protein
LPYNQNFETSLTNYCFHCRRPVHRSHKVKLEFQRHETVAMGRRFPTAEQKVRIGKLPPIRRFLKQVPIPDNYDLRNVNGVNYTAPIGNQGQEGSCGGWGVYGMIGVLERLNNTWVEEISPRDIYNNARNREGNLNGEGIYLIDAINALVDDGVCRWHYWPYYDNFDNNWPCPNANGPVDALDWKIAWGANLATDPKPIEAIQLCIMQLGAPYMGTPWTQSWMDNWLSGNLPLPAPNDPVVGGHAWVIIAWKTISGKLYFILQNSWGVSNLLGGYGQFPAETLDMAVNQAWHDSGDWEGYKCGYVPAHVCDLTHYWDPKQSQCVPDGPSPGPDPLHELIQCLENVFPDILKMIACIETFLQEEGWLLTLEQKTRLVKLIQSLKKRKQLI